MEKTIYFGNNKKLNIDLYRAKDEFSIGLQFQNDFEKTIAFNLTLPFLFKIYISLDTSLCKTNWWKEILFLDEEHKYEGRDFMIQIFPHEVAWGKEYVFNMNIATYPWYSGGGWSLFKSSTDFIYGNYTFNMELKEEWSRSVFIPGTLNYSDGTYDLVIRRKVSNWKWERFNKTFSSTCFEIECEKGVPHRFKWGSQDRIFYSGFDASNVDDAIQKFINMIQEARMKYSYS